MLSNCYHKIIQWLMFGSVTTKVKWNLLFSASFSQSLADFPTVKNFQIWKLPFARWLMRLFKANEIHRSKIKFSGIRDLFKLCHSIWNYIPWADIKSFNVRSMNSIKVIKLFERRVGAIYTILKKNELNRKLQLDEQLIISQKVTWRLFRGSK